jgi:hypothetical protein
MSFEGLVGGNRFTLAFRTLSQAVFEEVLGSK